MKEVICPWCNGTRFYMRVEQVTLVDFGREGAIEGHPFIENSTSDKPVEFACTRCLAVVPHGKASKMRREVI